MQTIKPLITPLAIGSFFIVAVTGVLLFFKLDIGLSRFAHEWLGWLMLLTVLFHAIVIHKRSMGRYFTQSKPRAVIGLSVLLMVGALLVPEDDGMPPFLKAEQALYQADINLSTQVLGLSEQELQSRLGITLQASDSSLQMIAERKGMDRREMMGALLGH
ncbi:MAG: DUF4405 domain-containing protein [Chromatiales bacterium]|nr:DUF4405 domain-containing protein [Chromatiales bacterium]